MRQKIFLRIIFSGSSPCFQLERGSRIFENQKKRRQIYPTDLLDRTIYPKNKKNFNFFFLKIFFENFVVSVCEKKLTIKIFPHSFHHLGDSKTSVRILDFNDSTF